MKPPVSILVNIWKPYFSLYIYYTKRCDNKLKPYESAGYTIDPRRVEPAHAAIEVRIVGFYWVMEF